jgi:hypothetical protein
MTQPDVAILPSSESSVQIKSSMPGGSAANTAHGSTMMSDTFELEHQLQAISDQQSSEAVGQATQSSDTLHIKRNSHAQDKDQMAVGDLSADEIFIDLKGNLVHKDQSPNN